VTIQCQTPVWEGYSYVPQERRDLERPGHLELEFCRTEYYWLLRFGNGCAGLAESVLFCWESPTILWFLSPAAWMFLPSGWRRGIANPGLITR
jgi:hypothetical protein